MIFMSLAAPRSAKGRNISNGELFGSVFPHHRLVHLQRGISDVSEKSKNS